MKRQTRTLLKLILFMAAVSSCVIVTAAASIAIPSELAVPISEALALETDAVGTQNYVCSAVKDDPKRFEWRLKAPEANLFDSSGRKIGKHYGGPTWESNDGSKVEGVVAVKHDGPDASAIPWLLLNATSSAGVGVLTRVKSVQRLATVGGKAPEGGCDRTHVGKEARVAYKAVYRFYALKP